MNEQEQLDKLDELIALVQEEDHEGRGQHRELPREHLSKARAYLMGAMPVEYRMTLEMAKSAIDQISDADLKRRADRLISSLLDSQREPR